MTVVFLRDADAQESMLRVRLLDHHGTWLLHEVRAGSPPPEEGPRGRHLHLMRANPRRALARRLVRLEEVRGVRGSSLSPVQ